MLKAASDGRQASGGGAAGEDARQFYAYALEDKDDMPIRAAPIERDWMDKSHERFAYRCLPLTIANQAGWLIHNPITFTAVWEGGLYLHNLRITFPDDGEALDPLRPQVITVAPGVRGLDPYRPEGRDPRITSHFGNGVVTIRIPYLFRTPPSNAVGSRRFVFRAFDAPQKRRATSVGLLHAPATSQVFPSQSSCGCLTNGACDCSVFALRANAALR